jgi:hypothetical protein
MLDLAGERFQMSVAAADSANVSLEPRPILAHVVPKASKSGPIGSV